jgi:hypothetical protein
VEGSTDNLSGCIQDRPNPLSDAFKEMVNSIFLIAIGGLINCHIESMPTKERSTIERPAQSHRRHCR